MPKPQRELEIKFSLSPEQRQSLLDRCLTPSGGGHDAERQNLRSIYFDTKSHALRAQGISWRLRHDGRAWRQTVKFDTGVRGGVSSPLEIETAALQPVPDLQAVTDPASRKQLAKLLGSAPLVPLLEANVERCQWLVPVGTGASVEVSADLGTITAGATSQALCEVEIELKSGAPLSLLEAVDRLFGADLPALAARSKAEQGHALLRGEAQTPPEPKKVALPAISKGAAGAALLALLEAILGQVLHNWQVVLVSDNPEGPHQLRIGLRRLRTLLRAFAPLLDPAFADSLKTQLRDLARLVGEVRDADVQVVDIVAPVLSHRDWGIAAEPLHALLVARRDAVRSKVRASLQSGPLPRFRIELGLLPSLIAHQTGFVEKAQSLSALDVAGSALRRASKRVGNRAGHIADLGMDERHALRKDLKTLRYTIECFAGLYPKRRVATFTTKLAHLQDLFGYINDVATAQRLMAELSAVDAGGGPARLALGYVIGWHTARSEDSWQRAIEAWDDLHRQTRFWKE